MPRADERSGTSPVVRPAAGGAALVAVAVPARGLGVAQWFRFNAREDARVEARLRAEAAEAARRSAADPPGDPEPTAPPRAGVGEPVTVDGLTVP